MDLPYRHTGTTPPLIGMLSSIFIPLGCQVIAFPRRPKKPPGTVSFTPSPQLSFNHCPCFCPAPHSLAWRPRHFRAWGRKGDTAWEMMAAMALLGSPALSRAERVDFANSPPSLPPSLPPREVLDGASSVLLFWLGQRVRAWRAGTTLKWPVSALVLWGFAFFLSHHRFYGRCCRCMYPLWLANWLVLPPRRRCQVRKLLYLPVSSDLMSNIDHAVEGLAPMAANILPSSFLSHIKPCR